MTDSEQARKFRDETRTRLLDAAIGTAADGGYGAVLMREVAQRADVAVGTVYTRFPSKVHLLIGALEVELLLFQNEIAGKIHAIADPADRLRFLVDRLAYGMQRSEQVAEALTRAYTAALARALPEADTIRQRTVAMFREAHAGNHHARLDRHVAEVLTDVLISEIIAVAQGRASLVDVRDRLLQVIDLIDERER